jgi:hypothetical protein
MNPARLLGYEDGPSPEPAMDKLAQVPELVATLKVDVEYIKRDVSEIKVALKDVNETLGTLDTRIHQNEKSLLSSQKDLTERIDGLEIRIASKIDSAKLWAMGLYVAQGAGLLFVMAKGLKWF